MAMTILALILGFCALFLLRQPIFFLLAFLAMGAHWLIGDGRIDYAILDAWAVTDQQALLAVPLFMLAGNIMGQGSIAARLIRIMRAGTSWAPGGLAIAAVLSCALFGAVSGSSTATLLAIGGIMYPALISAGYPTRFSVGLLSCSGTLGIIIPPSIPLILYGVVTQTSITDLFVAGIGPALLLVGLLTLYSILTNRGMATTPFELRPFLRACKDGAIAALMPVVVLGGLYLGFFTAVEAAAVAVVLAIFIDSLIYREMGWRELQSAMLETARLVGALIPVLMMALSIKTFLAFEQIPQELVDILTPLIESRLAFLLVSGLLLLLIGCFIDIGAAILVMAPLLLPLAASFGIHPVHFGIIMLVNLEIGYLTPPLGLNLIVAMVNFKQDFREAAKAALPFIGLLMIGLIAVMFWPDLSLFLIKE